MLRYVILEHDWPQLHWDLLLEAGEVLKAWRLMKLPGAGESVPADVNADHRLVYLTYEGPVSGGRGKVIRWDCGTFEETEAGYLLKGTKLIAELKQTGTGWSVIAK